MERNNRKVRQGIVVSDKMDKTVSIRVDSFFRHPLYGKKMKLSKKYKAHDEDNQCNMGDLVKIMETRPLSKDKRWRVLEIIEKSNIV